MILTKPSWLTPEFIARTRANAVLSGHTPLDTWRALEFVVDFGIRAGVIPKGVTAQDIHAFVHGGQHQVELPIRTGVRALVAKARPTSKAELYALLALIVALLQVAVELRPQTEAPQLTPDQIQQIVDEIVEQHSHLPSSPAEPLESKSEVVHKS